MSVSLGGNWSVRILNHDKAAHKRTQIIQWSTHCRLRKGVLFFAGPRFENSSQLSDLRTFKGAAIQIGFGRCAYLYIFGAQSYCFLFEICVNSGGIRLGLWHRLWRDVELIYRGYYVCALIRVLFGSRMVFVALKTLANLYIY